jgi:HAD superfamily hydrolase (TIGR01509 family)
MDGVIVDSEPHHERAFHEVLHELGYPELGGLTFSHYVGRSDRELLIDFIARNRPPHSLDELLTRKRERVLGVLREVKPIFAGLPELVQKLAAQFPLAVASGSEHPVIQAVLALRELQPYFSAIVSSTDVKHGKPAPDIFLRTAELLKVDPRDCVVIEDSKPGVAAGIAAGMQVIAITNTHRASDLKAATRVVDSYAAIEQLLLPVAQA